MSKLPQVSGSDVVRALQKIGFAVRRQHGSHIILRRDDPFAQTVVPNHRQMDRGTLRAILRQTDLSVDDFTHLLELGDALASIHQVLLDLLQRLALGFRQLGQENQEAHGADAGVNPERHGDPQQRLEDGERVGEQEASNP